MSLLSQGIELPFTFGFFKSRSPQLSIQQCVNYRPNINRVGALSQENLYQTEGLTQVIPTGGATPCRGSHRMNSKPYFVIGTSLMRLDRTVNPDLSVTYTAINLGAILGSGRVQMASVWTSTGYELSIVVPGQYAYLYREADGSLAEISATPNFLSPVDDVVSINGFLVYLQTDTNTVFHSNLNNGLVYNALDFELITRSPKLIGLVEFRDQLYIMCENKMLPYTFIGGSSFAFQYQPNSTIPSGIEGKYAKTKIRQSIAYLGGGDNESPSVWLTAGGNPTKISDESIDYIIRTDPLLSDAYLQSYAINGGEFIELRVGVNCFVYDLNTARWHTRRSRAGDADIPWRANSIVRAYGNLYTGDSLDGRIGLVDDTSTEYGNPIYRSFVMQPFDANGRHVSLKSLVLAADVGFDGDFVLSWSDDGFTWSDGLERSAGGIADYGRHIRWDRLGSASFARSLRFGTSSTSQSNVNKVIALP